MATTTSTGTTEQTIPAELAPYFTQIGTQGQPGYVPGLLPTAQGVFSRPYATTYQPLQQAGLMGAGRVLKNTILFSFITKSQVSATDLPF